MHLASDIFIRKLKKKNHEIDKTLRGFIVTEFYIKSS